MKANFRFCTLLILSAVCLLSCENKSQTNDQIIGIDLTEDRFQGISISTFKKLSALTKNSMNGESTRLVPITELGFNKTYDISIQKDTSLLMGNDYERTDLVNGYFAQVDTSLKLLMRDKHDRTGSVIFKVLAEELNKLSDSKADFRSAIFSTDLMENSFINFYDTATMNLIKFQPDRIKARLLKKYPLLRLNGIEIYLVYLPKDVQGSVRYEALSLFYKNLFESFGAKVHIVGTI